MYLGLAYLSVELDSTLLCFYLVFVPLYLELESGLVCLQVELGTYLFQHFRVICIQLGLDSGLVHLFFCMELICLYLELELSEVCFRTCLWGQGQGSRLKIYFLLVSQWLIPIFCTPYSHTVHHSKWQGWHLSLFLTSRLTLEVTDVEFC